MNRVRATGPGELSKDERSKRRMRTKLERRRVVEEILVPGASVAVVARAHGVNTNQIYHWRKLYERGLLEPATSIANLMPVTVSDATNAQAVSNERDGCSRTERGAIHITLKDVRLCVEGRVDEWSLRTVLEYLLR